MSSEPPIRAEMYDDGVPDEQRAKAIAHLQASFAKERDKDETRRAEQSLPALSAEERTQREGFSTVPITPEIRTLLANANAGIAAFRQQMLIVLGVLVGVEVLVFGLAFVLTGDVTILAIFGLLTAVGAGALLLGYRATQTWLPARDVARAGRLQSYYRYAGPCMIREIHTSASGTSDFFYRVTLEAPPAPPEFANITFGNWERHADWVGAEWRILDFVVTRRGPQSPIGRGCERVLRVLGSIVTFYRPFGAAGVVHGSMIALRDDHDRLVYDYQDG
ncbi:MAG: hypothetical protein ACYDAR_05285 [Thermomicrobiales bacterium]